MSITTVYKNEFGNTISSSQKERMTKFEEHQIIDGKIKKKINYYDRKLDFYTIYVYPEDDLDTELSNLTKEGFTYTVARNYELIGDYTTWDYHDYKDGVLDEKYVKTVYDAQGRTLTYATYDSSHTLIEMARKDYFLDGKILYDEDGEVDNVYNDDDFIRFDFTPTGLKIDVDFDVSMPFTSVEDFTARWQDLLPFMTTEVLNYFINEEPLVPNIEI